MRSVNTLLVLLLSIGCTRAACSTSSNVVKGSDGGITHGMVASLGYEFADGPETPGERERLQAENDWTVRQVAAFPARATRSRVGAIPPADPAHER